MKVGLVLDTTLDSDAGVQQYFKGLGRYLLEHGHDIRFLVPPSEDKGEFKGKIISFGKYFKPFGSVASVPISFFIGGKKEIQETLKKESFDVLHVGAPFSPFLGAKVISASLSPVLITYQIHTKNALYLKIAQMMRVMMRKAYRNINAYTALSEVAKEEGEKVIPGDYRIIPSGVDISYFSPNQKPIKRLKGNYKNILFMGRLEERKGVDYLIQAFKTVKSHIPNARLIIAGDGPRRNVLMNQVRMSELTDVSFEGYIDEEDKPRYYASADVCVFPAIYGESFGIVLIESMASGKPTVGFNNKGYSYVLRNIPELLIENKNVTSLADKITQILGNDRLRSELGRKCYEESKTFSWERVGNEIVNLYEELL